MPRPLSFHLAIALLAVGSTASTLTPFLAADINPFGRDGQVTGLLAHNGQVVFGGDVRSNVNVAAEEVFTYIPTTGSVYKQTLNLDSLPATGDMHLCVFNGEIYFQAEIYLGGLSTRKGVELGMLDSARSTGGIAADIFPGTSGSFPAFMTVFGERMFMSALGSDAQGRELWAINSARSPSLVHEFSSVETIGGDPKYLTVFDNKLFMQADSHAMNKGVELFAYDGTEVTLAADINAGAANSNPAHMAVVAGVLYMSADGGNGNGHELYAYDGTNAPAMVADVNAGPDGSFPQWLVEFSSTLYFVATTPTTGRELFRLDGSTAVLVADTNPGAGDGGFRKMAVLDGVLYIPHFSVALGWELHRLSAEGNAIALELDAFPGAKGSSPSAFVHHDEQLYFAADGGQHGMCVWKFNLTHGAELAVAVEPKLRVAGHVDMVWYQGGLVFSTDFEDKGVEPVFFNPITSTVTLLADTVPGSVGGEATSFCVFGDKLYFSVDAVDVPGVVASNLFRYSQTDGAARVGSSAFSPEHLTVVSDEMFMSGFDDTAGRELWSYKEDGEPARLLDLRTGDKWSSPSWLTAVGDTLFFAAKTDSSEGGTYQLCKYHPATEAFEVLPLPTVYDLVLMMPHTGELLFRAQTSSSNTNFFSVLSNGSVVLLAEFSNLPLDVDEVAVLGNLTQPKRVCIAISQPKRVCIAVSQPKRVCIAVSQPKRVCIAVSHPKRVWKSLSLVFGNRVSVFDSEWLTLPDAFAQLECHSFALSHWLAHTFSHCFSHCQSLHDRVRNALTICDVISDVKRDRFQLTVHDAFADNFAVQFFQPHLELHCIRNSLHERCRWNQRHRCWHSGAGVRLNSIRRGRRRSRDVAAGRRRVLGMEPPVNWPAWRTRHDEQHRACRSSCHPGKR
ncbi:hypothetical protein FNF31_04078 [Cafeteria roenbergensis]|uniref:Uncharacterized protein n=1 Tax=Cafeteria roenbergensis TaxID=33653 RepID=A0A5A8D7A9_CAFRO|nr:hypothetical protein FNF31_04078 [Cafeteria roenbergensis]